MPLECPSFTHDYNYAYSAYNACLDCRYKHGNECWYFIKSPRPLSDILIVEERLAILEQAKSEIEPVFRARPVDREIDQLKAGLLYLQNKLNGHLDKSKKGDRL